MFSQNDLKKKKKGDLLTIALNLTDSDPQKKGLRTFKKNELISWILYTKKKIEGEINPLVDLQPKSETDLEDVIYVNENMAQMGNAEDIPKITSPEWTKYVLSQFSKDELFNEDKPTCDGLRRVFELLIGEIHDAQLQIVKPPTISDPDTSVIYTIRYRCWNTSEFKTITEGYNVNPENTKYPWSQASVGTAATKAEARALRKGLRLQKVLAQEEVAQGFDFDPSDTMGQDDVNRPIAPNQKMVIHKMSSKLNIDVENLLLHMGLKPNIDLISYHDAHLVIEKLNIYQRGPEYSGEAVPDDIKLRELNVAL